MPWRDGKPLNFSSNPLCLNIGQSLDEEVIPSYIASQYYPPKVGGILKGQYQVVGKSGYRDVASIVWLVRDMK